MLAFFFRDNVWVVVPGITEMKMSDFDKRELNQAHSPLMVSRKK